MAMFGLCLLLATGAGLALTGLPAFLVVFAAAATGALVAVATGFASPDVFSALPLRVGGLLESDLFQAIPLYVLMGALLNRLPVTAALFGAIVSAAPRRASAPLLAGLGLGVLLGPMNGSVGASVLALSRSLAPRLEERGVPAAQRHALVVVASTFGVVVPPSLVLILLGDAMMSAHTIALNATGRADRIVNTQDVFRGALAPAALFLVLAACVAIFTAGRGQEGATPPGKALSRGEIAISAIAVALLAALLGAVAAGYLYVVEAAAFGAVALFCAAWSTGRLAGDRMAGLLAETMAGSGALFALLIAATTLTLALRVLGTDRLVADGLAAMPGSSNTVMLVVLAIVGASALVLDAFEIIFVVIPIVAPPLLARAPDAVSASVLLLLALQASFIMPPFGYALMVARGALPDRVPAPAVWRALAPYLAAQLAVLAAVFLFPGLAHWRDPTLAARAPAAEIEFSLPRAEEPPPLNFGQ